MIVPTRTKEQLRNHYEVESALANKLKAAKTRDERSAIYATMYDELFEKVPDHPRLTQRSSPELTDFNIRVKESLVNRFLKKDLNFAEFAPGDCTFDYHISGKVKSIIGIDISDQRSEEMKKDTPDNFKFITYNGYDLDLADIDLFYSDQLIEHIHPDETQNHFDLVHKALKKNGKYIFRIPHRLSGPHDISKHFSKTPTGFHLNEPTFKEMAQMVSECGFSSYRCYWNARTYCVKVPYFIFYTLERILNVFPHKLRKKIAKLFMPYVAMVATK